jgi:hypothetical protein
VESLTEGNAQRISTWLSFACLTHLAAAMPSRPSRDGNFKSMLWQTIYCWNCCFYISIHDMKSAEKQYKFINSETGYVIHYHTLNCDRAEEKVKEELDNVKAQVAIKNDIFVGTVYWEVVKDEE